MTGRHAVTYEGKHEKPDTRDGDVYQGRHRKLVFERWLSLIQQEQFPHRSVGR